MCTMYVVELCILGNIDLAKRVGHPQKKGHNLSQKKKKKKKINKTFPIK